MSKKSIPNALQESSEQAAALGVLKDVMRTLLDDPGSFDHGIEELCEHLVHFVTKEETIREIVNLLVEKGWSLFHF